MTGEIRVQLPTELVKKLRVMAIMDEKTISAILTEIVEIFFSPKK